MMIIADRLCLTRLYGKRLKAVIVRNGFEDEKVDVEWGFQVLLPKMAESDCQKCIFIMNDLPDLNGEIDLWTKKFSRYFQVHKVCSYEEALRITA